MTAQISERLRYQGEDLAMRTTPLSDYFSMSGIDPSFERNSTALWRGYVGRWEIVDGRLYLIEVQGTLKDGTEVSVATFFPEFPDRVFAHWYSGTIRIPRGKLLEYVHMGFASVFEQDLLLDLERGAVTNIRVRQNGTAPQDAPEGDEVGAMTVFRRTGGDDGGAP